MTLPSNRIIGHSKPLLDGMRRMVKGGHIIDLIYCGKKDEKENKDMKEEMISIRRLKFILSQLYHCLVELESLAQQYDPSAVPAKLSEPSGRSIFDAAWNSGRKRYFDLVLESLPDPDRTSVMKERRQRLRKLDNQRAVYSRESIRGMGLHELEQKRATLLGVCKICDKPNIPFSKLATHSQTCKKIKEIKEELLKVNEWLIAECQKAAQLKDKLFKLNTPAPVERRKKNLLESKSIQGNGDSDLVKDNKTPNPRGSYNYGGEKSFLTAEKKTAATKPAGDKDGENGKESKPEDNKDKRQSKLRKCNSNDNLELESKTKDGLKEEKENLVAQAKTQKKETKNSMSEDEKPPQLQASLSSSDEEMEKPSPVQQRFSHFKQYKLPSGQYTSAAEAKNPVRIESSCSVTSNLDQANQGEAGKLDDMVPEWSEIKKDEQTDNKVASTAKVALSIDDNPDKKKNTSDFVDGLFGSDSDKESSQHSEEHREFQPVAKPSSFFSRSIQQKSNFAVSAPAKETKKVEQPPITTNEPVKRQSDAFEKAVKEEEFIHSNPESKESSGKSSCFGDQFNMDDDSSDEDNDPTPKPTDKFKKSCFGTTSAQPSISPFTNESKKAEPEEPKEVKLPQVAILKTPVLAEKIGSFAADALPEAPAFISGLLEDSEDDSNCLGATSRSERSNHLLEEKAVSELSSSKVTVPPPKIIEPVNCIEETKPKEEETKAPLMVLNLVKKRITANETTSTKNESIALQHSNSATSQPVNGHTEGDSQRTKEATDKADSEAQRKAQKEKMELYKKLSKKPTFQTQVREKEQKTTKTDLDDQKELEQQNLEFKQLKLAQECFSQIVW